MSLFAIGIIGLIICFVLIFLRVPIYIAFAAVGFFGVWAVRGLKPALSAIGSVPYSTASMYVWTVVPLFVFMGFMALHSGLAQEFFIGVRKWIGHFRGGLAMAVVVGNTGFGACTGDPVSAAATFTAMCLPEMRKFKYDDKLTLGAIGAASVLAGLIPPSLSFILYGALTETSIGRLFIAGIIPGLLLTGLYLAVIVYECWRNPDIGPPGPQETWRERWRAGTGMWALIAVFAVIIGGIFAGLFTPTEAGAAGAFIVCALALIRRKITWQGFKETLFTTGVTVGMVGFLLIGTMVFNVFLVVTHVPMGIAQFIGGVTESPVLTLWVIVVVIWILGMFIDALALALIMIPILFPVACHMGIDPVHFGVVTTVAMLSGCLTPPFGIVIYAVAGTAKDVPLFSIFRGALPFLIAVIVMQVLVVHIPQLSTFLPGLMFE
ncbi:MAG: TRAP transporter large permease [Deltaproteobacteria bacterium]|nr:TRAP transporter large permease [Deltaproteobacteria bacterium]